MLNVARAQQGLPELQPPPAPVSAAPTPEPSPWWPIVFTALSSLVSLATAVSTILLAWRADRRSARELDLKVTELRLQVESLRTSRASHG